jgi:hypothetical protein
MNCRLFNNKNKHKPILPLKQLLCAANCCFYFSRHNLFLFGRAMHCFSFYFVLFFDLDCLCKSANRLDSLLLSICGVTRSSWLCESLNVFGFSSNGFSTSSFDSSVFNGVGWHPWLWWCGRSVSPTVVRSWMLASRQSFRSAVKSFSEQKLVHLAENRIHSCWRIPLFCRSWPRSR